MPDLSLEIAKAVAVKAVEYGGLDKGELANATDEWYLTRAKEVLEIVEQADENGSRNESVLEVLHAAGVEPQSEDTREAYNQRFGTSVASNGSAQLPPAPSEAQGNGPEQTSPVPVGSPEPAREAAPVEDIDISSIYPGYDNQKVADIKKAILFSCADGSMTPEEWGQIKDYEAAHEERKTILSLEPEFKAPEPEPVLDPTHPSAPEIFPAHIATDTSTSAPTASSLTITQRSDGATEYRVPTGGHTAPGDLDVPLEQVYNGEAISRAQQEGLPIAPHIDLAQVPIVPVNITDISEQDLSALGATFHSLFARGQWLLSQEEGRATMAEHLEREAEHDAYMQAYSLHREQIPEEKRTQPTALEAARKQAEKDAETNEKVRMWRSRRVRHGAEARELKALTNGWDKGIWRVDKELDRRTRAATTARAAS